MRKVLCSLGIGPHADLLELAKPTYETYAHLHGYDLVLSEQPLTLDRPAAWNKVPLIRQLLGQYELIMWVDADAMVVNPEVDIVTATDDAHFLWMVEHHVDVQDEPLFNSGVMVVRSSEDAAYFFDEVWKSVDFIDHPWWEQAAIMTLLGFDLSVPGLARLVHPTPCYNKVGKLSTEWNSMVHDPHPSPRIVHFPGMPFEDRLEKMTEQLKLSSFISTRRIPNSSGGTSRPRSRRPGVSVVLPVTKGPPEPVLASLVALSSSGLADEDEVIVVNDGSELYGVMAAISGARIVSCAQPFGLFHAWQVGWEKASKEVVVLLSAPVRPMAGWLDGLVEMLDDPSVGVAITTEIGERSGRLCLLGPGEASVLAARRSDLLKIKPKLAGSYGQEGTSLALELVASRQRAARCPVSFVRPSLNIGVTLRSIPPPASAAEVITWFRWTYGRSLSFVPCREEFPFLLNARGLMGTGVEVGVQRGFFSAHILTHWGGEKLISVDPWLAQDQASYVDIANQPQDVQDSFYQETVNLLSIYGSRSEIWRMFSKEAAALIAEETLDFVYLDARHDYESVLEDLETWYPKVRLGGIMAGHDYVNGEFPEGRFAVREAVDEFFAHQELNVHVTTSDPPWFSWLVEKG